MCNTLQPGDKIPTHTVLMVQLGASERTVLRALDDLLRAGRIIRRQKAGTFVAEPAPPRPAIIPAAEAARTIVAITRPDHAFFSRSVEVLYKLAKASNLSVLFQPVENDVQLELPLASTPYAPSGYIVIGSVLMPLGARIAAAGHRCVAIGEAPCDVAKVHPDNSEGGFLCAEHLIRLGHRRLGFTMDPLTTRWEGHQRAVAEARLDEIEATTTLIGEDTIEDWASTPGLAANYFRQPNAPTAVCLWNDGKAMQFIDILKRDNISVPGDVSVAGYDNLPDSARFAPSLTTVDTNVAQQLRSALRLLTQDPPASPATEVILSPTLIVRNSTRAIAPNETR